MEMKVCIDCEDEKEIYEFYSQIKQSKTKGEYIYYQPYCKDCSRKRSLKYKYENINTVREKDREFYYKRRELELVRMRQGYWDNREKRLDYHQEWRQTEKGKEIMREHSRFRNMHKTHNITDEEWDSIKEYFNYQCAYCGISEIESKIIHKQNLHKDHIYHDGNNDIDNCVPACRSCNTSKHDIYFNDWYNENNPKFNIERLDKIIKWATKDYKIIDY